MHSEDAAFYYHLGFLPDALREALIYDLQVKRFARGGSTITMQLVKNVFLNKNKNGEVHRFSDFFVPNQSISSA